MSPDADFMRPITTKTAPHRVSSAIIVEQIFEIPGLGFLISSHSYVGDFSVLSAVTFLGALIVIGTNVLVDVLYSCLDPRIGRGL